MAGYIPNVTDNTGLYVPTTDVWELSQIANVDINSEEFKLLLVRLYQNINNIAYVLNLKESAYYLQTQFVTGQQFFPDVSTLPPSFRGSYRLVVNTGALAAGVTTIAHGLTVTSTWQWTRIYGTATNTGTLVGYPMPWAGAGGTYIDLHVTATNVVIDNGSGVTFDKSMVILEFLKS
jgi:hypothetical protein